MGISTLFRLDELSWNTHTLISTSIVSYILNDIVWTSEMSCLLYRTRFYVCRSYIVYAVYLDLVCLRFFLHHGIIHFNGSFSSHPATPYLPILLYLPRNWVFVFLSFPFLFFYFCRFTELHHVLSQYTRRIR